MASSQRPAGQLATNADCLNPAHAPCSIQHHVPVCSPASMHTNSSGLATAQVGLFGLHSLLAMPP